MVQSKDVDDERESISEFDGSQIKGTDDAADDEGNHCVLSKRFLDMESKQGKQTFVEWASETLS